MTKDTKLEASLLLMRLTIAAFLLVWAIDKVIAPEHAQAGVVTLSQTERYLPTIANVDAKDFKHLACWLIVQIGPIHLM